MTLALNWAVAFLKIAFGLSTRCMVIAADGFHSFSDGTSNIIGLIAISVAAHPADSDHPYGHQKYETLASTVIAFLLFLMALGIFRESVLGFLYSRRPEVSAASFLVMTATLAVNLFVVAYERRSAKRWKSDLLASDAWHTLTDVFITLSVLVALAGIRLGLPKLDAVFSFLIGVVILVIAVKILKHSSDVLCDKAVIEPARIERIVRQVGGVRDCHEIRTRGKREDVYVDLHVLVDNDMTVIDAHRLSNIIECDIRKGIEGVRDVVVHIEPVSHDHEELEDKSQGK